MTILPSSSLSLSTLFSSTLFLSSSSSSTPSPPLSLRIPRSSTYNVQITVGDDEPEERVINRFKRAVLKAGVLQDCRRRRFFENKHDKIKRKAREAARKYRKRKPQPRAPTQNKHEVPAKKMDDEGYDNWEIPDADLPYC